MKIEIDRLGVVIGGKDVGSYVKVLDDAEATGGFLILTFPHADMSVGFDSWVEDREALAAYFAEVNWAIEWLEPGASPPGRPAS